MLPLPPSSSLREGAPRSGGGARRSLYFTEIYTEERYTDNYISFLYITIQNRLFRTLLSSPKATPSSRRKVDKRAPCRIVSAPNRREPDCGSTKALPYGINHVPKAHITRVARITCRRHTSRLACGTHHCAYGALPLPYGAAILFSSFSSTALPNLAFAFRFLFFSWKSQ